MRRLIHLFFAVVSIFLIAPSRCRGEFRSIDGAGNNLQHPQWGVAGTAFARLAPADYDDGISTARLLGQPNPRSVGLALMRQAAPSRDERGLSGYVYAFGNLLSHDMQHTISGQTETVAFQIPFNDDQFIPNQTLSLTRSRFDSTTGSDPANPRQQTNFATPFIDASPIYGTNDAEASILRGGSAHPGAKLKTSDDVNFDGENMLPHDAFGPRPDANYVAGDDRVNDNIVLTCLQTVFMREHN
ncbi:MAG: hypothetical protein KDA61_11575, partial [Planctomycetales bacterium]|nr:hypothetical protein [Planctomycetales bacterium]